MCKTVNQGGREGCRQPASTQGSPSLAPCTLMGPGKAGGWAPTRLLLCSVPAATHTFTVRGHRQLLAQTGE